MGDFLGGLLCSCRSLAQCFYCKSSVRIKSLPNLTKRLVARFSAAPLLHLKVVNVVLLDAFISCLLLQFFHFTFYALQVLGKVIDIRLKSPGWIKSLEDEMNVERICGSIPTSASSTLLAEDTDMGDDDYDMEGME